MKTIQIITNRGFTLLGFALMLMILCLLPAQSTANASIVIDLDDDDLVKNASVVVYARIGTSESLAFGTRIATRYQIEVLETIKGKGDIIHFLTRGGQAGDFIQTVTGEASFEQNQEVILFLEPIKAYHDELLLVGLSQGAVYVDDGENTKPSQRMLHTQSQKHIRRAQNTRMHIQNNDSASKNKSENLSLDTYLIKLRNTVKAENTNHINNRPIKVMPKTLDLSHAQPSEAP